MLYNCLAVGCGGFIGATLRYLFGFLRISEVDLPVSTLAINVVGSFAIAFFSGLLVGTAPADSRLSLFLRVGLCGGFTTFSTFSMESLDLIQSGNAPIALAYMAASCGMCVLGAFVGQVSAGAIVR